MHNKMRKKLIRLLKAAVCKTALSLSDGYSQSLCCLGPCLQPQTVSILPKPADPKSALFCSFHSIVVRFQTTALETAHGELALCVSKGCQQASSGILGHLELNFLGIVKLLVLRHNPLKLDLAERM